MYFTSGMIVVSSLLVLGQSSGSAEGVKLPRPRILLTVLLGALAGFLSGFLGIGGGFILVPLFIILLRMSAHGAIATSLVSIAIYSLQGSLVHYELGNVSLPLLLPVGIGSILGAHAGSRLALHLPEKHLKASLGAFFLMCAAWLAWFEMTH